MDECVEQQRFNCGQLAAPYVLDLLREMFEIDLIEAAFAQEFGCAGSPLHKIRVVQAFGGRGHPLYHTPQAIGSRSFIPLTFLYPAGP